MRWCCVPVPVNDSSKWYTVVVLVVVVVISAGNGDGDDAAIVEVIIAEFLFKDASVEGRKETHGNVFICAKWRRVSERASERHDLNANISQRNFYCFVYFSSWGSPSVVHVENNCENFV